LRKTSTDGTAEILNAHSDSTETPLPHTHTHTNTTDPIRQEAFRSPDQDSNQGPAVCSIIKITDVVPANLRFRTVYFNFTLIGIY
jgi:hypothetical protein